MIGTVWRERLAEYAPKNSIEQENALHEIVQQYVLASLAKTGFFSRALFHGGTCLRLVYDTARFSEDLDFLLKEPDLSFSWEELLSQIRRDFVAEGISVEVQQKRSLDRTVVKAFLKVDSSGGLLHFQVPFGRHRNRRIRVKLEIDSNPPLGSTFETAYLTFPRVMPLTVQSLTSGFALKLHALLCRRYIKGRDWFDLIWYVGRKTVPDLPLLANALDQQGPWAGRHIQLTPAWLVEQLAKKVSEIDWQLARDDVERFLPLTEQEGLEHWNEEFFQYQIRRMKEQLEFL